MRYFLLLLALLLAAGPAVAQNPAVAARPDSLPATQAATDTAAAIHRLFAAKRKRRDIIAAGLGLSLVAGTVGSLATAKNPSPSGSLLNLGGAPGSSTGNAGSQSSASSGDIGWLLCAALSWPLIVVDYVAYAGYSRKREKKAMADYEAGYLSIRLRKRLQAKCFQPAKTD